MTIGTKLSAYRKLAGYTQQQIGDYLNISAQAVSKWENNQAEPDLATIRALANLYKVSVDEMLDPDCIPYISVDKENTTDEQPSPNSIPIGFCMNCGVTMTEENVGETDPVMLCKKCAQAKKEADERAEAKRRSDAEAARAKADAICNGNRRTIRKKIILSSIFASIVFIFFLIVGIATVAEDFSTPSLMVLIILPYLFGSFVFCLFYDCFVQDAVIEWASKSIPWPGLIFTFDLDGILWLIGMKLLFWVLGFIFGIITLIIGIFIACVCAPFVFPFLLGRIIKNYKLGTAME